MTVSQPVSSGATDYTQDANCIGAWFMNESLAGDDEDDQSSNNADLVETSGDIPTSSTVPDGYSGTSRDFEEADSEYLDASGGSSLEISGADQQWSMCAWVWVEEAIGSSTNQVIAGVWDRPGNEQQYAIRADGQNASQYSFDIRVSADGSSESKYDTANVNEREWVHVCGVYNDVDVRGYVNGVLDTNETPPSHTGGIYNGTEQFRVGVPSSGDTADDFDGLIDELIVFDRALTADEVSEIYENGIDGTKGGND